MKRILYVLALTPISYVTNPFAEKTWVSLVGTLIGSIIAVYWVLPWLMKRSSREQA